MPSYLESGVAGASPGRYEDEDIPKRDSSDARIGSQLAYMNDQLSKTQALLTELEQRILQILIPDGVEKENLIAMDNVPRKMASELSNTIDDLNSQIGRLQRRIMVMTERVQL